MKSLFHDFNAMFGSDEAGGTAGTPFARRLLDFASLLTNLGQGVVEPVRTAACTGELADYQVGDGLADHLVGTAGANRF
jgi:hypothetical protein